MKKVNFEPLVSIVLTSYNQKEKLLRAFNSLIGQTYKNIQIIIVDDFSTDDSRELIINLANKYPKVLKYHFQSENVGIPKNKNTGFKLSDGTLITYLDGDDVYLPNKIKYEVNFLKENPDIDVVYSNFYFVDNDFRSKRLWLTDKFSPTFNDYRHRIVSRDFPYNTVYRFELMRAEVLKKIDYYNEKIKAFHDWDSRIRYSNFSKIGFINNIGAYYVDDPEGISKRLDRNELIDEMLMVLKINKHLFISDKKDQLIHKKIFEKLLMRKSRRININNIYSKFIHILKHPQDMFYRLYRKIN